MVALTQVRYPVASCASSHVALVSGARKRVATPERASMLGLYSARSIRASGDPVVPHRASSSLAHLNAEMPQKTSFVSRKVACTVSAGSRQVCACVYGHLSNAVISCGVVGHRRRAPSPGTVIGLPRCAPARAAFPPSLLTRVLYCRDVWLLSA